MAALDLDLLAELSRCVSKEDHKLIVGKQARASLELLPVVLNEDGPR